jgi:hypothetical protein
MKKYPLGLLLLAVLASGCVPTPHLMKPSAWDKAKPGATDVADAKTGKFHYTMKQMMGAAEYMFETEGFPWKHRDDDADSFKTDPLTDEAGVDNQIKVTFTQEDNGVVSAKWVHTQIIKYKDTDVCQDKPDCQGALADDWNWRLYRTLHY